MKYLTYFYTDVFGLTAVVTGVFLAYSRWADGFTDVIIGIWADRTETRWGKFRPFMIFGSVIFAIAGILTFTTPGFLGDNGKLIWAIVTYNFLMIMYTVVNIPYTALMGVMTNDPVQRTRLSSIKFIFAFSAGIVISATLLPMADYLGGGDDPQKGWSLAFVIVGVVAVLFLMITGFGTKERIKPKADPDASLKKDLKILIQNKPWVLLLCTTLTWILFVALRSSVSPHYFKYYIFDGSEETTLSFMSWDFTFTGLLSTFNTLGQAASVAGVILIGSIADRFTKKGMFIFLLTFQILCTVAYVFLTPGQMAAIFILEIVGNFAGAPLPVLMWAMYADTADYGEWKTGRRTTALVFSASTMSQKIGWGIAAWVALSFLGYAGFVANEVPSESVKNSLVHLMSTIPSLLGVVAILIFLFFPLNEKKMAQINSDLADRKGNEAT